MNKNLNNTIDIYRGLLAQYVIISHLIPALFAPLLGVPGTLAVWCFFITSGYLNYLSLYRNADALPYYSRRVFRLYPLLLISFLVIAFTQGTVFLNDAYTLFPFVFWVKDHMPLNGVLWTLIIELQLYFLSPFIFRIIRPIRLNHRIMILMLCAMPALSLLMSGFIGVVMTGGLDLDDRTILSALPLYLFGMLLAQAKSQNIALPFYSRKLLPLLALALFLLVVLSRNSSFIPWPSLYLEGRLIPFLLTAFILSGTLTFGWLGRQHFALALGRLTYEIYLLHGLFVYLLMQLYPDAGGLFIVAFFWMIPLLAAFMYDFGHRALLKRMRSS